MMSSSERETLGSLRMAAMSAGSSPTPKSPSSHACTASIGVSARSASKRSLFCMSLMFVALDARMPPNDSPVFRRDFQWAARSYTPWSRRNSGPLDETGRRLPSLRRPVGSQVAIADPTWGIVSRLNRCRQFGLKLERRNLKRRPDRGHGVRPSSRRGLRDPREPRPAEPPDPAEPPTWWRRLQVAATSRSDNQSLRRCGAIRATA